MSEFHVQKVTDRHPEPTKRILCLTEATVLERDPQTYSVSIVSYQAIYPWSVCVNYHQFTQYHPYRSVH